MKPRFYVIIPRDVPQLVPGKLAAQCCHAQSMMCEKLGNSPLYKEWSSGYGFGTVITLYSGKSMKETVESFDHGGIEQMFVVEDPTYPMKNERGDSYTIAMITCFGLLVDLENPSYSNILDEIGTYKLY